MKSNKRGNKMKIGLFASVHSSSVLADCGYDENKIIRLFDKFGPDIICGEVRKEDYENNADYQGPGEYRRYVFKYCKDRGIRFEPCDWYDEQTIAANQLLAKADFQNTEEFKRIMEEYMEAGRKSAVPFNSDEYNNIVKTKQDFQKKSNPDIHKIVWEKRNEAIVNNIVNVIKNNPDSKILVIFGAEHIYWLKNELSKMPGVQLIFPLHT